MRYAKGHKEAARKRILDVSSRRFRRDGLEAVGIADLMKAAGLTHGGFYFHFPTKGHLIREAVNDALDESNTRNERIAREGLEALVRSYLQQQNGTSQTPPVPLPHWSAKLRGNLLRCVGPS